MILGFYFHWFSVSLRHILPLEEQQLFSVPLSPVVEQKRRTRAKKIDALHNLAYEARLYIQPQSANLQLILIITLLEFKPEITSYFTNTLKIFLISIDIRTLFSLAF